MGQKVLVIGSGAREHAIAHALLRGDSVSEVTVASGNPGMELDGIRTTQINESNHAAFISFMQHNQYDWAFVGPEVPLIEGLVDDFAAAGIKAFGPNKAAAQIEGSKDFAKQLMARHNIPPPNTTPSTTSKTPSPTCANTAPPSSSRPTDSPPARVSPSPWTSTPPSPLSTTSSSTTASARPAPRSSSKTSSKARNSPS